MARCYGMIDLGTQYSEKFGNWAHKVLIQWELPNELMDDERPASDKQRLHHQSEREKERTTSAKTSESWLGRPNHSERGREGFALGSMLGAPCLLSIIHTESGGEDLR